MFVTDIRKTMQMLDLPLNFNAKNMAGHCDIMQTFFFEGGGVGTIKKPYDNSLGSN